MSEKVDDNSPWLWDTNEAAFVQQYFECNDPIVNLNVGRTGLAIILLTTLKSLCVCMFALYRAICICTK